MSTTKMRHGTALLVLAFAVISSTVFAQDVAALGARLKGADPIDRTKAACAIGELGANAKSLIPQLVATLGDAAAVPGDTCGDWGRWWKGRGHDGRIPETTPGERAAQALVSIGSAAVDPVVQALRSPQWHARTNAAWTLGALDDRRGVEPLKAALKDTEAPVRRNAAWALGALDDDQAVNALIAALKDVDAQTRSQAAWALGAISDERAVAALAAALDDSDAQVRSQAAWALGAIGSAEAVTGLARSVQQDKDAEVRAQAAWALGAIGDGKAAASLAAALKDPDAKVRRQAAWALGAIDR
jgi:HEAT repeat protein